MSRRKDTDRALRELLAMEMLDALRDPPPELVEAWSRATSPETWERIDEARREDQDQGWNYGTALNLRQTILREDRAALIALAPCLADHVA
jgi:hypothetical protein